MLAKTARLDSVCAPLSLFSFKQNSLCFSGYFLRCQEPGLQQRISKPNEASRLSETLAEESDVTVAAEYSEGLVVKFSCEGAMMAEIS